MTEGDSTEDKARALFEGLLARAEGKIRPDEPDLLVDDDDFDIDPVAVAAALGAPETGMVVVRELGDPQSRGAKELFVRFQSAIGQELPFAGKPAPATQVKEALVSRYPWAEEASSMIAGQVALATTASRTGITLPPLLLVGPPGSGKSSLLAMLAEVLELPSRIVPCGGSADTGGLQAVSRGWSTAQPSGLFMAMHDAGCANPLVVLDEVDKSTSIDGKNGSVSGALISLLSDASRFFDNCLMADVDLSAVTFGATANSLKALPPALLDRFSVVEIPRPRPEHFPMLLREGLRGEAKRLGVPEWSLPQLDGYDAAAIKETWLKSGRSLRALTRCLRLVLGSKAMQAQIDGPSRMN